MSKIGADLSEHQNNIDFKAAAKELDFVILRSTVRKRLDYKFLKNASGFKSAGVNIAGIYHFTYARNEADAKADADLAISAFKQAGLKGDSIIFYDFEYDTVTDAKKHGVNLTPSDCQRFTKVFCDRVKAFGYKAGVYLNQDYYKNWYQGKIDKSWYVWLADYTGGPNYPCTFQQYTSSHKVTWVDSASKNVDMNYFFESESDKKSTNSATKTSTIDFSKYKNMISNSGHDENGKYAGGKAGDQSGTEWYIRSWYKYPYGGWNAVLRYPDKRVGEKLAEISIKAANNNKIGYDQYQRNTYWENLKSVSYDPSKITNYCEADCSAGVIANVKAVGFIYGISKLQNVTATVTWNMRSSFKDAGFDVLTDSKYLNGTDYLQPGDVILNDKNHVCVFLGIGDKSGYVQNVTDSTSTVPFKVQTYDELANDILAGRYASGDERKRKVTEAGFDYATAQLYVNKKITERFVKAEFTFAKLAKDEGYTYNDSHAMPPCSDGVSSCDRLEARALYDIGYKDQRHGGETIYSFDGWLTSHGWVKSTDRKDLKYGSIVLLRVGNNPVHAFTCLSYDYKTGRGTKLDHGSTDLIKSGAYCSFTGTDDNTWGHGNRSILGIYNLRQPKDSGRSVDEIAREVIAGKWGNAKSNPTREVMLKNAGYNYADIQARVNELLGVKAKPVVEPTEPVKPVIKSIEIVAKEVISGKWGTASSNPTRKENLESAGYNYEAVQSKVNELLSANKPAPAKKSDEEIAKEVLLGLWGNGDDRINRLKKAGYNPSKIQTLVNSIVYGSTKKYVTVKKGDTFWGIATANRMGIEDLKKLNPQIENFNIIHIGDKVRVK